VAVDDELLRVDGGEVVLDCVPRGLASEGLL
jgi:hypothetical protein